MPATGTEVAGQDVQKQHGSAAEAAPEAQAAGLEPADRPASSQPDEAAQVADVQGGDSSDSTAARQAAAGADICAMRAQIEQDVLHELQGHETVAYLQQLEDTNSRQGRCCIACLALFASRNIVEGHTATCWCQLLAPSTPAWQAIEQGNGIPTALTTLSCARNPLAAVCACRVPRDLLHVSVTLHSVAPTS